MLLGHAHLTWSRWYRGNAQGDTYYFLNELGPAGRVYQQASPCADQAFTVWGPRRRFFAAQRGPRPRDKVLKFEGGWYGMQ